jgi:hypothetical protein
LEEIESRKNVHGRQQRRRRLLGEQKRENGENFVFRAAAVSRNLASAEKKLFFKMEGKS